MGRIQHRRLDLFFVRARDNFPPDYQARSVGHHGRVVRLVLPVLICRRVTGT